MEQAIFDAAYGALNYQKRLEALSNNLANVNTAGFKQERPFFRVPKPDEAKAGGAMGTPPGRSEPEAALIRRRAMIAFETRSDFSQGQLRRTGNPFDLGIEGRGFFAVQTGQGVAYTRKGSFTLDANGTLVTGEGRPVLGQGGEIQITGGKMAVDTEGNVYDDGNLVDRIRIVDFADPQGLVRSGDTLFAARGAGTVAEPVEEARISQGYLELSNVDPMRTMTEIIEVVRGFESYQKVIQAVDQATGKTINEVGRL